MRTPAPELAASLLLLVACDRPPATAKPPAPPAAEAPPAASVTLPADAARLSIEALSGSWRVRAVALRDSPVQAYLEDDPKLLGQLLVGGESGLEWRPGPLDGACRRPATMRLTGDSAAAATAAYRAGLARFGAEPDPHEIACLEGGDWGGPDGGALLFRGRAGRLVMSWYDNLLLELEPAPASDPPAG